MRSATRLLAFSLAVVALAGAAIACGDANTNAKGPLDGAEQGGVYLALGDSFAAGTGASDRATTSYVALVYAALQQKLGGTLQLQSLAVGGHTTQDLIDQQLPAALEALRAGDVRVVTITIGGNDLFQYSADPDCLVDPSIDACPLRAGLTTVEDNLDRTLTDLHDAGPNAVIVIEVYPDIFSGSGHVFEGAAKIAFGLLDDSIERVANDHDVLLADPRAPFAGRSTELTHIADPMSDFHPNDAGHRLIADAFLQVLGLHDRASARFTPVASQDKVAHTIDDAVGLMSFVLNGHGNTLASANTESAEYVQTSAAKVKAMIPHAAINLEDDIPVWLIVARGQYLDSSVGTAATPPGPTFRVAWIVVPVGARPDIARGRGFGYVENQIDLTSLGTPVELDPASWTN